MSNFVLKVGGSSTRGMTQAISSNLKKLDKQYLNLDGVAISIVFDFISRGNVYIDGDHLEDVDCNYFFLQVFTNSILINGISASFQKDCFLFFEKILGDLSNACAIAIHDIQGTKIYYLREYKS